MTDGAAGKDPRVSVCIPVFQCERYIGEAVQSVLDQTCADFELVVLDNASQDNTVDEVLRFKDPRIRVLVNERNIGAAENFNRALAEARGRYVKIVCADDLLYPDCLRLQARVLDDDESGSVAMVTCARDVVDADGSRLTTRRFPGQGKIPGRKAIRSVVRSGTNPIGEPAAVLMRADRAAAGVGGFNAEDGYAIDVGYWARLMLTGDLYVLDGPLCAFRLHEGGWSSELRGLQSRQYRSWVSRLRSRPEFGVTALDAALSSAKAELNALGRAFYYSRLDRAISPDRSADAGTRP